MMASDPNNIEDLFNSLQNVNCDSMSERERWIDNLQRYYVSHTTDNTLPSNDENEVRWDNVVDFVKSQPSPNHSLSLESISSGSLRGSSLDISLDSISSGSFETRSDTTDTGIESDTSNRNITSNTNRNNKRISNIQFHQLNMQHSKSATHTFYQDHSVGINLFQEPWTYENKLMNIPKSWVSHYVEDRPRACITHSKEHQIWFMPMISDRDVVACLWLTGNSSRPRIMLISCYWDINNPEIPVKLKEAIDYCEDEGFPFICGMDSNAHSTLWGSPHNNARGNKMEDYILEKNVNLINRGNKHTFVAPVGRSHIDITFSSADLTEICHTWYVDTSPNSSLSDHRMIKFKIKVDKPEMVQSRPLSKAHWKEFQKALAEPWPDPPLFWTPETVDKRVDMFYERLEKALDLACPKRWVKPKVGYSWWNEEAEKISRKARVAYHKAAISQSQEDWQVYREARSERKRIVNKIKRDSWRKFVSDTATIAGTSKLLRTIHSQQNKHAVGAIKTPNGLTKSIEESLGTLMNIHFPMSEVIDSIPKESPLKKPMKIRNLRWLQQDMVWKSIKSFGPNKAPGMDGIKPIMLQNMPEEAVTFLSWIFQASISLAYVPQKWRQARVIFIPKAGKDDYTEAKSFRPITLTSFVLKTLEKLIVWEAEMSFLSQNPFHEHQHAFRRNYGCDTALSRVINRFESGMIQKKFTLALFIDIEGAYDNLSIEAQLQGFQDHGYPEYLIQWYENYLRGRYAQTSIGKIVVVCKLVTGTPQGGITSPSSWNMAFDKLLDWVDENPTNADGFADDLEIDTMSSNPEELVPNLQQAIDKAEIWASSVGVRISPTKSVAMLFKWSKKEIDLPPLKIYGKTVEYVESVKYLGMTLDPRLSWIPHIKSKVQSSKRLLLATNRAIGATWGHAPKLHMWGYTGMVRPKVLYGCHLWAHRTSLKTVQSLLKKLQRQAMIGIAPMRDKTPTAGLEMILGIPPAPIIASTIAKSTFIRINRVTPIDLDSLMSNGKLGHLKKIHDTIKDDPVLQLPSDCMNKILKTCHKYEVNIGAERSHDVRGDIIVYTDGSKMDENVGAAYVIYENRNSALQPLAHGKAKLSPENSVFQAEVHAIEGAASYLIHELENVAHKNIVFYSDSQSALNALNASIFNSKRVFACYERLTKLAEKHSVNLEWVKAHVGIQGNEAADFMAKMGAKMSATGPGPLLPVPGSLTKAHLKKIQREQWGDYWYWLDQCRQTKLWFPNPDPVKSERILKIKSRPVLGQLIRWITGHNNLRRHRQIIDPWEPTNKCRFGCSEEESAWHIMADCPSLVPFRYIYFNKFFIEMNDEWDLGQMKGFLKDPFVARLEEEDIEM